MAAARTAPDSGPTQKTHWLSQLPETAAAPKDRAGLMLLCITHNNSSATTRLQHTIAMAIHSPASGVFSFLLVHHSNLTPLINAFIL